MYINTYTVNMGKNIEYAHENSPLKPPPPPGAIT